MLMFVAGVVFGAVAVAIAWAWRQMESYQAERQLMTYLFDYTHEGKAYSMEVRAVNEADAKARVRAMAWSSTYVGPVTFAMRDGGSTEGRVKA